MPRMVAPPPSGEFTILLSKPFSGRYAPISCSGIHSIDDFAGTPTHTVHVIGEPNRPAVVRVSQYNGGSKSSEKSGDVPK